MDSVPILSSNNPNQTRDKAEQKKKKKKKNINICSWNIRRGLVIREQELKSIINSNSVDIIFLVETDTVSINNENDYRIPGFKTVIQNKKSDSLPTRIICLINEGLASLVLIRMDLSSVDFPSLWVEIENTFGKNIICGGFYREWAPGGISTVDSQVQAIGIFTKQIERAANENKSLVVLGDANLCCESWDSPGFLHKRVADELRETLTQCGMSVSQLGTTYTADRLSVDGSEITSAIDHIYVSMALEPDIKTLKLPNSATDHLPILASLTLGLKEPGSGSSQRTITKRSMREFNKTRWIDCLRNRNWTKVSNATDVNNMTTEFTNEVTIALDECAPYKKFKVRKNFQPGLSETAKELMRERDSTRQNISRAADRDKPSLKAKYKRLRNRAINQIRKDTLNMNADRIAKAKNEGETWRVVNDIIKPKNSAPITIRTSADEDITDETEVAEAFNKFFVDKISNLKANIDPNYVKDPLSKIEEKVKHKNLKFKIKTVTVSTVQKAMKKMAKKKSKGSDDISQECLILGLETLAAPLTEIINASISTGVVPEQWKEAIVVPILKKGDPKDLKNYRPVSCLAAASKVLERVVCDQLTHFVEVHDLLPNSQHGFRSNRSTMTALSAMQKDWMRNTEDGLMTGILVWDLSSAFDTLDIDLFLKKMVLYGADDNTVSWFHSFLCDRKQRVRIGGVVSNPLSLASGVPQGGILSPIVFTLYTADMELWLKTSKLTNYADDTTTGNKSKSNLEIKLGLEEDAINVLNFMASNGLIANKAKTEFLLLNEKGDSHLSEIRVGDTLIQRTDHTKLLGIQIEESQEWNLHLKTLKTSLNQRLFVIRRVMRQIPRNKLMMIVHSLWMSKLRYGLQLCTKVRQSEQVTKTEFSKSLQLTQNRMLRLINNSRIKDKISVKSMLKKFNLLSVNQLAAQIKLQEVWKSVHIKKYGITLDPYNAHMPSTNLSLRPKVNRTFNDSSRLVLAEHSFTIDAAKLWNNAPSEVTSAKNLSQAKKASRAYALTLPI